MLKRKALMESISSNLHSFLKKNRQKFAGARQKIRARQPYRTASVRQSYRLSNGTASAKSTNQVSLATGPS